MVDYRKTLNLPQTSFPMRANLPEREPQELERWNRLELYRRLREARRGRPKFVLHDGPPYANGDIHVGTALNKVVKDLINRVHMLSGQDVAFVPGFDTHGLPIEMRALRALGVDQHHIEPLRLRRESAGVARHYIGAMTDQFRRLGVLGDWEHPYVTLDPGYEAEELRVFADMVERGLVYRDLKPVFWCPHCETALAEGEIEYREHDSDAVYVAFALRDAEERGLPPGTRAVIWTTTPWTLPANVAIALHPELSYVVVETDAGPLLVARARMEAALTAMGKAPGRVVAEGPGRRFEGAQAQHPFLDRTVPLVLGEHVTADSGSGLVHTAPGHGVEDFEIGRHYRLPVLQPLDDRGRFAPDTPLVGGQFYAEANLRIVERLAAVGALLAHERMRHAYPFCWRCHNPVVYRATAQWFLAIEPIRDALVAATFGVRWDPEWGGGRMRQMVEGRQDWCLSRQRVWGLPIPALYCQDCGHALLDAAVVRRVAEVVGRYGSDVWWTEPVETFLPPDLRCPACGGRNFRKERDIFDVWMDSGCSQAAAFALHPELDWPPDLILEGADQFRGWFNTLLTTAVATRGQAPYRGVLTHGWVLDGKGRPMHKSLGNVVDPMDLVARYGADVFRLWVAASEFRSDVRISEEHMGQLAESYRKIRNTFRFLLGNLADYQPPAEPTAPPRDPLNRWALVALGDFSRQAREHYGRYLFHLVVHQLVYFTTVDLSSFYLDVVKDRLYTLAPADPLRKETQAVLWQLADWLTRLVAPVLVFTAEELWRHLPGAAKAAESVHLVQWPDRDPDADLDRTDYERVERLRRWRDPILKALEALRAGKQIGNALEALVRLRVPAPASLEPGDARLLEEMALVAGVEIESRPGLATVEAEAWPSGRARCERCWRHPGDVGDDPRFPDLCLRCVAVLDALALSEES